MKASIALQILPLSDDANRLPVIEKVIAFLQSQPVKQLVLLKENQTSLTVASQLLSTTSNSP